MYPRYVTAEAEKGLKNKIDFPNINSQDWEYEVADPSRIEEFLNGYENLDLDIDEKFALMIIIVESYDQALSMGISEEVVWEKIRRYLIQDIEIHRNTIIYWSLKEEEYDEDLDAYDGGFAVTSRMRAVYDYCNISPDNSNE